MKQYEVEEQIYLDSELRDRGLQPMQTRNLGAFNTETAREASLRAVEAFRKKAPSDYGVAEGNALYALIIVRGNGEYLEAKAEIGTEAAQALAEDALRGMPPEHAGRA